ncbi:hypothetical protein H310_04561 [Aphanomyces invadans]|uniref:Uncharacterized protein n=1 Tax=Aphanomyces invadans TaxID=157072 RepID=A0A024UEZ8_9STRA|nr:hypothetical protein H310_04561 [Aphanomyces invadans]ETW04223.1 hypothetical protein H310_04561 [Aphanomyces invadans]|eukprot:XP_008867179.1 hypothetical protein H310_04561 [Aphanomyces invadans]
MPRPAGGKVRAPLNFFSHTCDGAFPYSSFGPQQSRPSGPATNIVSTPHLVDLHDMRGHEAGFALDAQGFMPVRDVPSLVADLLDTDGSIHDVVGRTHDVVKTHMEAIVRRVVPSPTAITVFTVMARSSNPQDKGLRRPSPLIHVDHTLSSGDSFVTLFPNHIQAEIHANRLRVRILSVWQPLVSAVHDWPLALADARTSSPMSLLDCETRFASGKTGAMSVMTYDPNAEWWYWSAMSESEVLVIKNYDSKDSHGCAPHTSFVDRRVGAATDTFRKSIEARVLVASSM